MSDAGVVDACVDNNNVLGYSETEQKKYDRQPRVR